MKLVCAVGGCLEEVDVSLHWQHVFVGKWSCIQLAWERKMFSHSAIAASDCPLSCRIAVE